MGKELRTEQITEFLNVVGSRVATPTALVLLGGSALSLLGNSRPTLDLDYEGEERATDDLRTLMEEVALELHIDLEAVPLHRFIPIPSGADERHVPIGRFGDLQVLVFDPYSIALSKLDRGFDTDIEDIVFLLRRELIDFAQLGTFLDGVPRELASQYDLDLALMRVRLDVARSALNMD
ncbi:MAG: hypothetical protein IPH95_20300 [Candidatus Promineofilum sp.]|nr:hypothetical protein [Promineifilum sp.]